MLDPTAGRKGIAELLTIVTHTIYMLSVMLATENSYRPWSKFFSMGPRNLFCFKRQSSHSIDDYPQVLTLTG